MHSGSDAGSDKLGNKMGLSDTNLQDGTDAVVDELRQRKVIDLLYDERRKSLVDGSVSCW